MKKVKAPDIRGYNRPEKIVYVEEFNSRSEAMKREREIKSLSHKDKQRLINS